MRSLMIRLWTTLALACGLLVATPVVTHAVVDFNKSIVWVDTAFTGVVVVPFETGNEQVKAHSTASCTGFFVSNEGDIATASHCLAPDNNDRLYMIAQVVKEYDITVNGKTPRPQDLDWKVSFDNSPQTKVGQPSGVPGGPFSGQPMVIAQVIAKQTFVTGDNALLRVANMKDTPALTVAEKRPELTDPVTAIGFPASVSGVSDVTRQSPSYKSGQVSSFQTSTRGVPRTEIDAAVSGGMSGGPTINQAGEVIGINSFGVVGETQSFNFVTDTETMRNFMAANGVDLAPEPITQTPATTTGQVETTTPASSGNSIVWVLLGALAVSMIAGGVAIALLLGRLKQAKRSGQVAPTPNPGPDQQGWPPSPQTWNGPTRPPSQP